MNKKVKLIWILYAIYCVIFYKISIYILNNQIGYYPIIIFINMFLFLVITYFLLYFTAIFDEIPPLDINSEEYKAWSNWYRNIVSNFFENQKKEMK